MSTIGHKIFTFILFIAVVIGIGVAAAENKIELPGGASSLRETYQDWIVSCQIVSNTKLCSLSQEQQQQNGQRVLAIELQSSAANEASGVAVMPFGLKLNQGVKLQIDEQEELPAVAFSTCLPAGCILPVSLDAKQIASARAGQALKLKAASVDGREMNFSVSLKGFSAALDRLLKL